MFSVAQSVLLTQKLISEMAQRSEHVDDLQT